MIDPHEVRRSSRIQAPDIPVNAYQPDAAAEAKHYTSAGLVNVYHDMLLIREYPSRRHPIFNPWHRPG